MMYVDHLKMQICCEEGEQWKEKKGVGKSVHPGPKVKSAELSILLYFSFLSQISMEYRVHHTVNKFGMLNRFLDLLTARVV